MAVEVKQLKPVVQDRLRGRQDSIRLYDTGAEKEFTMTEKEVN